MGCPRNDGGEVSRHGMTEESAPCRLPVTALSQWRPRTTQKMGPATYRGGFRRSAIMNSFVRRENLRRWRSQLVTATDETVRNQLCRLIAEEERELLARWYAALRERR